MPCQGGPGAVRRRGHRLAVVLPPHNVATIEHGAPGVYNIVDDDPAPVAVWLPDLARVLGAKLPWRVPVWLGRLAVGEVGVSMMTQIRGTPNAKAKRELEWQPRYKSWRDGFRTGLTVTAPGPLRKPPAQVDQETVPS